MKRTAIAILLAVLRLGAGPAGASVVFDQPHDGSGTLHKSAWYPPDGLDGDAYCWDDFTLAAAASITEVRWRGGYEFHPSGTGQSPVTDFEVSIYRSIPAGTQPDLAAGGRLVQYNTGGNAGETPAGSFGGVALRDYSFTLPSPFPATAGAKYWVRIVAWQGAVAPSYAPDWGLAVGTGGDNHHFRYITGGMYQAPMQDLAFKLVKSDAPTVSIAATAAPPGAGTVAGAGAYPIGSLVSLQATPNAGWGFLDWTESGTPVSSNAHYTFTASVDRTLVANFVAAWTITTAVFPPYGGTATGGGVFNDGATVTLVATANAGFVFAGWSDGSTTATVTFPATSDLQLTAFFDSAPGYATFDFDNGTVGTSLPLTFVAGVIGAQFSGGYSIQPVGTLGIAPQGFSGLYLFPNSVFASDLVIDFDRLVDDFSLLYAPDEIACDTSALMRVTGYRDGRLVGTRTMTAPVPGTYPSGTLRLQAPPGFNHVVVHWEAPGLACGDYAPIFFADIVTVMQALTLAPASERPLPAATRLLAPMPNPFNPSTTIRFEQATAGRMQLDVFDCAGRHVRGLIDEVRGAGEHRVRWDGTSGAGTPVGAGLYLLRLRAAGVQDSRRLVLVK